MIVTGRVVALTVLAACAAAQRSTPPFRIVSLVPAMTEIVYALGAGDEVVGVSSYDTFPPEVTAKPHVGGLVDPDFERILQLKPNLVIVYASQRDLIARLARASVPVFTTRHGNLADIGTSILDLGRRLGREPRAREVAASLERELGETRRRVAGRPKPKTVLIIEREPGSLRGIYASAGFGFMHDMLDIAGGVDVFDDVKRESLQVSVEILLARAPEVIIEVHSSPGWTPGRIAKERDVWKALASLPAVRTDRVYVIPDDRLASPGPRIAQGVRVLAQTLHPDAFKQ